MGTIKALNLRTSSESRRVIWSLYLHSFSRGEKQESQKEGKGFTYKQGRNESATNFLPWPGASPSHDPKSATEKKQVSLFFM